HSPPHPALHSFPTRRSSDLPGRAWRRSSSGGASGGAISAVGCSSTPARRGTRDGPRPGRDGEGHYRERGAADKAVGAVDAARSIDRKSTRLNSSHLVISYAV